MLGYEDIGLLVLGSEEEGLGVVIEGFGAEKVGLVFSVCEIEGVGLMFSDFWVGGRLDIVRVACGLAYLR